MKVNEECCITKREEGDTRTSALQKMNISTDFSWWQQRPRSRSIQGSNPWVNVCAKYFCCLTLKSPVSRPGNIEKLSSIRGSWQLWQVSSVELGESEVIKRIKIYVTKIILHLIISDIKEWCQAPLGWYQLIISTFDWSCAAGQETQLVLQSEIDSCVEPLLLITGSGGLYLSTPALSERVFSINPLLEQLTPTITPLSRCICDCWSWRRSWWRWVGYVTVSGSSPDTNSRFSPRCSTLFLWGAGGRRSVFSATFQKWSAFLSVHWQSVWPVLCNPGRLKKWEKWVIYLWPLLNVNLIWSASTPSSLSATPRWSGRSSSSVRETK